MSPSRPRAMSSRSVTPSASRAWNPMSKPSVPSREHARVAATVVVGPEHTRVRSARHQAGRFDELVVADRPPLLRAGSRAEHCRQFGRACLRWSVGCRCRRGECGRGCRGGERRGGRLVGCHGDPRRSSGIGVVEPLGRRSSAARSSSDGQQDRRAEHRERGPHGCSVERGRRETRSRPLHGSSGPGGERHHNLGRVPAPHAYGLWRSLVHALVWGTRGREFESPQPDQGHAGFSSTSTCPPGSRHGDAPRPLTGSPSSAVPVWSCSDEAVRRSDPSSSCRSSHLGAQTGQSTFPAAGIYPSRCRSRHRSLTASGTRYESPRGVPGSIVDAGTPLTTADPPSLLGFVSQAWLRMRLFDVFGVIPPPGTDDGPEIHERYAEIVDGRSQGIGGDA